MGSRILVVDVGTTTLKAAVMDSESLRPLGSSSLPVEMEYPAPGYAELDVERLWDTVAAAAREAISRAGAGSVEGLVYVTQMAGVVPVSREGRPLMKLMTWLDERAAGLPQELFSGFPRVAGYNLFRLFRYLKITGGVPSKTGKDPLSKMVWVKRERPDVFSETWMFLDVKSYLLYRSTGNAVTSPDEANLTWLADTRNIDRIRWSRPLLEEHGLSEGMLPEIRPSTGVAGELTREAARHLGLEEGVPVVVGSGDVAAVAVGSGAVRPGEPHIYVGTSNWIAAHVERRLLDIWHYMGSLASAIPGRYLFIAEQEIAAGALEWLIEITGDRDGSVYERIAEMVSSIPPGSEGLIFLPWMYGERSPIDDETVRGVFFNLTMTHGKPHLYRAVMEGVAYNIEWAYEYFAKHVPHRGPLRIVGGGALYDEWCQIIADVLGAELERTGDPKEAGLRGGAMMAGVALGLYGSFEDAAGLVPVERRFEPRADAREVYERSLKAFKKLYQRLSPVFRLLNREGPGTQTK